MSTLAFEQQQDPASRHVESLVIDLGQLPRGRYRLQIHVIDGERNARASSAVVEFRLR